MGAIRRLSILRRTNTYIVHSRILINPLVIEIYNFTRFYTMDESPQARYGEGRRRKTVFRKIRTLCTLFNLRCMVILVDDSNRQWIFKTHDEVPGTDQVGKNI
jgi:hypothetical protein